MTARDDRRAAQDAIADAAMLAEVPSPTADADPHRHRPLRLAAAERAAAIGDLQARGPDALREYFAAKTEAQG